jgi:hypothetical protein
LFRVISTTLNLMFYLLTIYYRGDAAPVTNINQAMVNPIILISFPFPMINYYGI